MLLPRRNRQRRARRREYDECPPGHPWPEDELAAVLCAGEAYAFGTTFLCVIDVRVAPLPIEQPLYRCLRPPVRCDRERFQWSNCLAVLQLPRDRPMISRLPPLHYPILSEWESNSCSRRRLRPVKHLAGH